MTADEIVVVMYNDLMKRTTVLPVAIRARLVTLFEPNDFPYAILYRVVEAIFKNKDLVPAVWLTYAADAAEAGQCAGIAPLVRDNRGNRIAAVIRRMPGVVSPPADNADPVPLPDA